MSHKNTRSIKSSNLHNYVQLSSREAELLKIVEELNDEPKLCEELLKIYEFLVSNFQDLDKNQFKFSSCLMFFAVGRLTERDKNCITNTNLTEEIK